MTGPHLAISILNFVLRPVLARWHPLLLDYEHQREAAVSQWQHEASWDRAGDLREELNRVRGVLLAYTSLLARIAHVPSITRRS